MNDPPWELRCCNTCRICGRYICERRNLYLFPRPYPLETSWYLFSHTFLFSCSCSLILLLLSAAALSPLRGERARVGADFISEAHISSPCSCPQPQTSNLKL